MDEISARGISKEKIISFKLPLYRQFAFSKASPGKIVAMPFIEELVFSTSTSKYDEDVPELPAVKVYLLGKVPNNEKKFDDLQRILNLM